MAPTCANGACLGGVRVCVVRVLDLAHRACRPNPYAFRFPTAPTLLTLGPPPTPDVPGNTHVAQGLDPERNREGRDPVQRLRYPVSAAPAVSPRAFFFFQTTFRFGSKLFPPTPFSIRTLSRKIAAVAGDPNASFVASLGQRTGAMTLTDASRRYSTHTTPNSSLAGTKETGSASGARRFTASAARTSRCEPKPNVSPTTCSGSGASRVPGGATSRARWHTTLGVWRVERWYLRYLLRVGIVKMSWYLQRNQLPTRRSRPQFQLAEGFTATNVAKVHTKLPTSPRGTPSGPPRRRRSRPGRRCAQACSRTSGRSYGTRGTPVWP